MRSPHPLPAELATEPFTVKQAQRLSVPPGRLRALDLERPFRGVRVARQDREFADDSNKRARQELILRCQAYAVRMPECQHFSHVTAARLLGLPLPGNPDLRLHVTARLPSRAPRMRGIVGHHAAPSAREPVTVHGVPVAAPLEVWCQLATILQLDDLIAVGDTLVRRKHPFATLQGLADTVAEFSGRRGARLLRLALNEVRPGVDSPRETSIRLHIVRSGMPEPLVNAPIFRRDGSAIGLGDLSYPRYRILIEYDGQYHFDTLTQIHRDIDRLDDAMEEGWRVLRFNKSHSLHHVAAKVRSALLAAGWRPGP